MKTNNKKQLNNSINSSNKNNHDDFELANYDEKYRDLDYEFSNSQQQTKNKLNSNSNNNHTITSPNNNNNSNNNYIYKKSNITTSPLQPTKTNSPSLRESFDFTENNILEEDGITNEDIDIQEDILNQKKKILETIEDDSDDETFNSTALRNQIQPKHSIISTSPFKSSSNFNSGNSSYINNSLNDSKFKSPAVKKDHGIDWNESPRILNYQQQQQQQQQQQIIDGGFKSKLKSPFKTTQPNSQNQFSSPFKKTTGNTNSNKLNDDIFDDSNNNQINKISRGLQFGTNSILNNNSNNEINNNSQYIKYTRAPQLQFENNSQQQSTPQKQNYNKIQPLQFENSINNNNNSNYNNNISNSNNYNINNDHFQQPQFYQTPTKYIQNSPIKQSLPTNYLQSPNKQFNSPSQNYQQPNTPTKNFSYNQSPTKRFINSPQKRKDYNIFSQNNNNNINSSYSHEEIEDDDVIFPTQSTITPSLKPTQDASLFKSNPNRILFTDYQIKPKPKPKLVITNNQGKSKQNQQQVQLYNQQQLPQSNIIYPFLSKRSNSFKEDKKHFGNMFKDSSQQNKYSSYNNNSNNGNFSCSLDYSDSIDATQKVSSTNNNDDQYNGTQLSQVTNTQPSSYRATTAIIGSASLTTSTQKNRPTIGIIRSSSHISSSKGFDWGNDKEVIDSIFDDDDDFYKNPKDKDDQIEDIKSDSDYKSNLRNDMIIDDGTSATNNEINQDIIVDDNNNPNNISYSPPPPIFKDSVRRSPNSSKYKYVDEEIEDDDNNTITFKQQQYTPIKQQQPTNIFKLTKNSQLLKDEIKMDDDDIFGNTSGIENINSGSDNDEEPIINDNLPIPNNSSSLKNKWLGNLISSKNINSNDTNSGSGSTHSTPIKQLKLNKNHVRGGLVEKLSKSLNKMQYCMDIYSRKSSIIVNPKSTLPNHFKRDLNVTITELPSLLQPHVYVTVCKCINWVDNNSNSQEVIKYITVLFPMTAKTELKLKLGSNVIIEYWQLVQSDQTTIILSHISHLNQNNSDQDVSNIEDRELSITFETLQIKQPQLDLLNSLNRINNISFNNNNSDENQDKIIDSLVLNNETIELEKVTQNSLNIKLQLIFFKLLSPTQISNSSEYDDLKYVVYAGNQNGLMVEVEIPPQFINEWKEFISLSDTCFLKEIILTDLLFVSVRSESKYSFFGSFFYRYYPSFVSEKRDGFSITTLKVSHTSKYYIRSFQNQVFLEHYLPNKIGTISEVFDALAKSLVTYDSELDYYQRISIKGRVAYIDDKKKKFNIYSIYLVDSLEDSGSNDIDKQQHNISVRFENYKSNIFEVLKVGDYITVNDCSIEFPYKWKSILFVDKFSEIQIIEHYNQQQQQQDQTGYELQIYDESKVNNSNQFLKFIKDFIPLSNKNLNENIFRLYYQYQFILNFKGRVVDCKRNNFIYRGCRKCHSPVSDFPIEYLIGDPLEESETVEKFFCSICRSIVESLILVKLKLRIKLFNYDNNNNIIEFNQDDSKDEDETIVILKIDSQYCKNIFNFPIEYEHAKDYEDQLNQLVGKNIYFSGISTPKVNYKNEIHLFINSISDPIFN